MTDVKIGVVGCGGRMGQMLVREVVGSDGCGVAGGTEVAGSPLIGRDIGEVAGLDPLGLSIANDPLPMFAECDAVLDFTSPAATATHAALAAQGRTTHIIGTTGLGPDEQAEIDKAARHTTLVHAPNMSLGVNLLALLTERVASILNDDFDIEIYEMHHRHKVDAPSGTALGLGRAAAAGRGVDLDAVALRGRDGQTGARPRGGIGFAALRGGDVVGDHTVVFAADGERIELTHKASGREIYARGAVRAALWAQGKPPGLYSMVDVLGLD